MKLLLMSIMTSMLMIGCVSSSKYDEDTKKLQDQIKAERSKQKRLNAKLSRSNADLSKERQNLKQSQAELAAKVKALKKMEAAQQRLLADFKKKFKKMIDAGALDVKIEDGRLVVVLPSDILFPSGSAKIGKDGVATLSQVGEVLAQQNDGKRLQVEGHTDNVPVARNARSVKNNWQLGYARAMAVLNLLVKSGVSQENISAASYSKFRPKASNDKKEGRAKNRRIEIIVSPNLEAL